jgi:hypothetical protein
MSTVETNLSCLERVDLREVWKDEARDFTPWLAQAESIALLGETIDLTNLEVVDTEVNVGPYHADILCKDTGTGDLVVIENQLEKTDHDHLGKLLTYMLGKQAVIGVWIADRFIPEHRAALDCLNEIIDKKFNFFGLEIELWRIGTVPPAPKFTVVCKPKDWRETLAERALRSMGSRERQFWDFWTAFVSYVDGNGERIRKAKPTKERFMTFRFGRRFHLSAIIAKESQEFRAVVVFPSEAHQDYAVMEGMTAEIEGEMGESPKWSKPTDRQEWWI